MTEGFRELDTSVPLALLPVRLEARVMGDALKVRIFPDAIHADAHEEGLTDVEKAAGEAYWTGIWEAKEGDTGAITVLRRKLAGIVGAHRAVWVANKTMPDNQGEKDKPKYPDFETIEGAGPVMAALLPKRWTYRVYDLGMSVLYKGECEEPVAEHLAMAPSLGSVDEKVRDEGEDDGDDHVDEFLKQQNLRWMVDFERAKKVGMAFEIALEGTRPRFGAIVVAGARDDGALKQAEALDNQLRAHWYTDGADVLPQGTPTNNTEGARTGHASESAPDIDRLFAQDAQRRPIAAATRAALLDVGPAALLKLPAADALALAFGMTFACFFDRMANANLLEGAQASVMNGAIGSGLGECAVNWVLAEYGPNNSTATWRKVARHHIDWVRGAGPLPSLRVGDQPYGVLPIQNALKPETVPQPDQELVSFLNALATYWRRARPLAHLDPDATDGQPARYPLQTVETLLEVLGAVPHPQNLHQRGGEGPHIGGDAEAISDAIDDIWLICRDAGQPHSQDWSRNIREFQAEITGISNYYVSDPVAPSMAAQVAAGAEFRDWLGAGYTHPSVHAETLEIYDREIGPRLSEYAEATDAMPSLVADWSGRGGISLPPGMSVTKPEPLLPHAHYLFDSQSKPITVEVTMDGTLGRLIELIDDILSRLEKPNDRNDRQWLLNSDASLLEILVHQGYLLVQNADADDFSNQLKLLQAGLAAMKGRPADDPEMQAMVAALQLRQRESLSTFMNRLDAWTTSFAARRLAETRSKTPRGVMTGGYGWLLDFATSEDIPSQGYMLTPSMTHATSLGVLRSGWSGYGTSEGTAPLSVDLTSDRMRGSRWILDGVRNGQDLADILGARFERYVHDADGPLDRHIDEFRDLTNSAKDLPAPKRNLTDGYLLARVYSAGRTEAEDALRAEIDSLIDGIDQPQRRQLRRICRRLAQDLDAVADLLLAESVHSLAQGKDAQAGSVANLLGDEDGAVPPITVTASPQEGRPITHRVITICPPPAAKLESTAEHCEPAMAAWLRAQLPDLNEVGCRIVLEQKNGSTKPAGSILLSEVLASPMDALGLAQRGASQSGSRLERVLLARARLRSDGKEADKLALDLGTAAQGAALDVDSFGVLLDALRAALDSARPLTPADLSVADQIPPDSTETPPPPATEDTKALTDRVDTLLKHVLGRAKALREAETRDEVLYLAAELAAVGVVGALNLADAPGDNDLRRALIASTEAHAAAVRDNANGPAAQLAQAMGKMVPVLTPLDLDATDPGLTSAASRTLAAAVAIDGPVWFAQIAKVTPGAAALADLSDLVGSVASEPIIRDSGAVQLPHFANEPWAATGLPDGDDGPRVALYVTEGHRRLADGRSLTGFVSGSWTEVIPATDQQAALAYHFDSPSARAPQVILLSMLDERDPEKLVTELHSQLLDTVDQMKMRVVGPDRLAELGHYLPAAFAQTDGRLPSEPMEGAT